MRLRNFVITPQIDADGIAEAQTLGAAGALDLDGALVGTHGVARTQPDGSAGGAKVTLASAGDLSAVTFTVTGFDESGREISEEIAGPNANTVSTTAYFSEVNAIEADGAVGTAVTAGVGGAAASPVYVVNYVSKRFKAAMVVAIGGTSNVTVKHTLDNPWQGAPFRDMTWLDHDTLAAVTETGDGNYNFPPSAVQAVVNSWESGEVKFSINVPE